jgi:hypothetical protein
MEIEGLSCTYANKLQSTGKAYRLDVKKVARQAGVEPMALWVTRFPIASERYLEISVGIRRRGIGPIVLGVPILPESQSPSDVTHKHRGATRDRDQE